MANSSEPFFIAKHKAAYHELRTALSVVVAPQTISFRFLIPDIVSRVSFDFLSRQALEGLPFAPLSLRAYSGGSRPERLLFGLLAGQR